MDVVQIGAREHYAVPIMLERLGILRHLHTDAYAGAGSSISFAAGLLRRLPLAGRFARVLERRSALPAARVRAHNLLGLREALALRRCTTVLDETRVVHRFQRRLAEASFRATNPLPDAYVGFRGSDRLFELAKGKVACILDQIDGGLREVDVIRAEQSEYPDWIPSRAPAQNLTRQGGSWLDLEKPRLLREWELADVIVCNSNWTRDCLTTYGVAPRKCVVVPLAYEPRPSLVKGRGRPNTGQPFRVAFLGTLTLRKGIHLLLEAARLAREEVDIRVVMAGSLDIPAGKLAEFAGVSEYFGMIPREDVPGFLNDADVLALPSISEGFGIVQLEAMAAGLPVVASDRTGNIVRAGIDGSVVPAENVEALARALVALAKSPERVREMGLAARERSTQFGFEAVARGWQEAVELACSVRSGRLGL